VTVPKLVVAIFSAMSRRLLMIPILDSFGSGEGWGLSLLYPLSAYSFVNPYAWTFQGWQNVIAMFCVLSLTVLIGINKRRTPLEVIAPRLERRIVG